LLTEQINENYVNMDTRLDYHKDIEIRLNGVSDVEGAIRSFPQTNSESVIIAGLRNGDTQTIKEIFNTYFNRLFAFVFREVGYDQLAAEDIVQETFIGAVRSARIFNGKCQIYTWLVNIARHKIADHYRKLKREYRNRSLDNPASNFQVLIGDAVESEDFIESAEERLIVEQALMDLPPDYRQTLVLKYVEEMPVSEISQVMKRSPKSIEGLLTRAKKALKSNIENRREG
jgi:RNA polymerase sigma-70 factor, ECF subfamily